MAVSDANRLPEPPVGWPDRIAIAVLGLATLFAALKFRDYGLGWDDFTHAQYGDLLLTLYSSGFRDTRALSFVNLYYYGGGFDLLAAMIAKISPFDLFETRRLVAGAVGLIGLAITWRIGRRVGGPLAGLATLLLLTACPLYVGHMFINPKDVPFAVAMAVFLLGLVRTLTEYPYPTPATKLILGIGFGLSIGARIMAGFAVVQAVAAIALLIVLDANRTGWRTAASHFGTLFLSLLPVAIVAYAVMALVWPWAVADPLNPLRAIGYFAHFFEKPWQELFAGRLIAPPDMPRSYVPTLMMLKLPEIMLLLGVGGLAGMLVASCRNAAAPPRRAILLGVALAALLPIAAAIALRPAMYNGVRHFVFVLPPIAVAGGFAASRTVTWLMRFGWTAPTAAVALFVLGLTLPVADMIRLHPYQYAYFNHIAGGVRGAQSRFMLDYWGLAFKQAGAELQSALRRRREMMPEGRKWKIAVCGPHPPAAKALGNSFELTWDPSGADFALMLGTFYCAKLDAPLLVQIVRDGVVFARGYDLRGRSTPSLFTVPPIERDDTLDAPGRQGG